MKTRYFVSPYRQEIHGQLYEPGQMFTVFVAAPGDRVPDDWNELTAEEYMARLQVGAEPEPAPLRDRLAAAIGDLLEEFKKEIVDEAIRGRVEAMSDEHFVLFGADLVRKDALLEALGVTPPNLHSKA